MGVMPRLSVLDLSPVPEGSDVSQSLANTLDLARHAERLGYHRYWLAEHHNMPGIASAATAVVIGHVAAGTSTIRVGAGGIMLPNHAPYVIAEQFGTLAALHPGRIDLGLGRAPGTDQATSRALRRTLDGSVDDFPRDVMELMSWFEPAEEGQRIRATPGEGQAVEVWMLGYNAFAADTDEEARDMFTSVQQAFVNLRTGKAGKLPPPRPGYAEALDAGARSMIDQALSCSAVGSPETVKAQLNAFIDRHKPDELMVTSQIFDHAARVKSYGILAEAAGG